MNGVFLFEISSFVLEIFMFCIMQMRKATTSLIVPLDPKIKQSLSNRLYQPRLKIEHDIIDPKIKQSLSNRLYQPRLKIEHDKPVRLNEIPLNYDVSEVNLFPRKLMRFPRKKGV